MQHKTNYHLMLVLALFFFIENFFSPNLPASSEQNIQKPNTNRVNPTGGKVKHKTPLLSRSSTCVSQQNQKYNDNLYASFFYLFSDWLLSAFSMRRTGNSRSRSLLKGMVISIVLYSLVLHKVIYTIKFIFLFNKMKFKAFKGEHNHAKQKIYPLFNMNELLVKTPFITCSMNLKLKYGNHVETPCFYFKNM